MTTISEGIDGLEASAGEHLGSSDWLEVTRDQVNRFPSPLPVGSKLRAGAAGASLEDAGGGGAQVTLDVTFEVEGAPKPASVAQLVFRYYS
jgi:hypothetical protein